MKHKILLISLSIVFYVLTATGQTLTPYLISSGGDHAAGEQVTLSWSIGELAIETFQASDSWLTQGFHQGGLDIINSYEALPLDYEISVFPNPVQDFLTLQGTFEDPSQMGYRIFDFQGRLLAEKQLDGKNTIISFGGLEPSVYFIKVIQKNQVVKTFKIVKH